MKREMVESSNIESIGYGRYSSKLEIEFKNGDIFQYLKVSAFIYDWIISASCCSTFFENFIKNIYRYKKVA